MKLVTCVSETFAHLSPHLMEVLLLAVEQGLKTVRCDPWFKSKWAQHVFRIPQRSKLEFLSNELAPISAASEFGNSIELNSSAHDIRRNIISIVSP